MFPKWYQKLVHERLEGSGWKVVFFMSYDRSLTWNLIEAVYILYSIIAVLYMIDKNVGAIAGNIGIYVLLVMWSKTIRSLKYGVNCWYTPPEEKSEYSKLFERFDE